MTGLEDVVAAATVLSRIDGERGEIVLRGRRLEDLAGRWPVERVAALLWEGLAPEAPEGLGAALGSARREAFSRLEPLLEPAAALPPMDGLRLAASAAAGGPCGACATVAVAAAALARLRAGRRPVAPDPDLGHATDFLRMVRGERGTPAEEAALETYLVTVAEHGLNASTFAARVVASTRAGMGASFAAALAALQGPLHGGAPGPVLDMLDGIGEAERADAWIAARLAAGERLMGFGHRVYRVRDPRAEVLRRTVHDLARGSTSGRLALAAAVEESALRALARHRPGRSLQTNVEFYTAVLLEALGFPRDSFPCVFAVGRSFGWAAHVLEQERDGRLIRPTSRYVGPEPA